MTVAAAITKRARLAVGAVSPAGSPLSFTSFSPGCTVEQSDFGREVSIGQLTNQYARVVANRRLVRPRLTCQPSLAEWQALLPMAFNLAGTGSGPVSYALGETPLPRFLAFDDTAKKWEMSGVCATKTTVRGRTAGPVELEMELLGIDFGNPGSYTFPAAAYGTPFVFKAVGLTVAGAAAACDDFELAVEVETDPDRFFNSATLAGVIAKARVVSFAATMPWGQAAAIWDAGADTDGAAVVLTLAGAGGSSLAFAMPAVKSQQNPYDARVPDEIRYRWQGMVLGSAAPNDELTAVLTLSS